ncbi:hypothetical protein NMY22_g9689 [Coprinellus aureogranulatus]|nr:hypothetical protein NMY22_g9689 [Coprinellus aureogranulatus]
MRRIRIQSRGPDNNHLSRALSKVVMARDGHASMDVGLPSTSIAPAVTEVHHDGQLPNRAPDRITQSFVPLLLHLYSLLAGVL